MSNPHNKRILHNYLCTIYTITALVILIIVRNLNVHHTEMLLTFVCQHDRLLCAVIEEDA